MNSFGAKGDGHTDDTAAIQSAINAASSVGGSVVFGVTRYYTTGTFVVPRGVVLCGTIEGPFDVVGSRPPRPRVQPLADLRTAVVVSGDFTLDWNLARSRGLEAQLAVVSLHGNS